MESGQRSVAFIGSRMLQIQSRVLGALRSKADEIAATVNLSCTCTEMGFQDISVERKTEMGK